MKVDGFEISKHDVLQRPTVIDSLAMTVPCFDGSNGDVDFAFHA